MGARVLGLTQSKFHLVMTVGCARVSDLVHGFDLRKIKCMHIHIYIEMHKHTHIILCVCSYI